MNFVKCSTFIALIFLTLVSCENSKLNIENSNQHQALSSSSKNQNLPLYFRNAIHFNAFINSDDLPYDEKEAILNDFFSNIEEYSINDIALSFALIGSNTKWDVDLISQFQHNMQQVIIENPEILKLVFKKLDSNKIENFANFYLGNIIWNNNFPNEIYYLNSFNPDAFKTFISVFYELCQSMSDGLVIERYIISDKDGQTNIRMEPSSKSSIVGSFTNGSEVSSMWSIGNWHFVYNGKNLGYVHLSNIIPAEADHKNFVDNDSSKNFILTSKTDVIIDEKKYKIVATKPKLQDVRNFNVNIEIYESNKNGFSLLKKNTTMFKDPINGCMMDGLESITVNSNFFTIEYSSCYDNKYAHRKVSFAYDQRYKDFKIVDNKISFINNYNELNQTFDCKYNGYLFSSYDDSCKW